jgi:hypothetical protein
MTTNLKLSQKVGIKERRKKALEKMIPKKLKAKGEILLMVQDVVIKSLSKKLLNQRI